MSKRVTTTVIDAQDEDAFRRIEERWGTPSHNAAIRLAVRVVAQAETLEVPAEVFLGVLYLREPHRLPVRLAPADDAAIGQIRARWEVIDSDAAAIRLALRLLAAAERLDMAS